MERYGSVFWVYFNLLQAPWIYVTLKMLSCVRTSPLSDVWVLENDPSIKCSGSLYEFHRAIAIILCVVWIFPLPVYSYLFTRRWLASRSIDSNIRVACRALFQPFQETFISLDWYFQMRRVLIWTMICLVPSDYRTYMGSVILFGLGGSEISLSPFVQLLDNAGQAAAAMLLLITCTVLSSSAFTPDKAQTFTPLFNSIFYGFLACLVAFLVFSFLYYHRNMQGSTSAFPNGSPRELDSLTAHSAENALTANSMVARDASSKGQSKLRMTHRVFAAQIQDRDSRSSSLDDFPSFHNVDTLSRLNEPTVKA